MQKIEYGDLYKFLVSVGVIYNPQNEMFVISQTK